MSLLRRLSIQKKLLFSMGLCLLLFMAMSSFLSVRMSSDYVRERVVGQELPAQVGEIRNDVLRQISQPLSVVQTMANDVYLQDWEDAGLPDSGASPPSSATPPSSRTRTRRPRSTGLPPARASISPPMACCAPWTRTRLLTNGFIACWPVTRRTRSTSTRQKTPATSCCI